MIRKFTQIDDFFRRAAAEYEDRPSDKVWKYIESQLPGNRLATSPVLRWRYAAALLFLLLFSHFQLWESSLRISTVSAVAATAPTKMDAAAPSAVTQLNLPLHGPLTGHVRPHRLTTLARFVLRVVSPSQYVPSAARVDARFPSSKVREMSWSFASGSSDAHAAPGIVIDRQHSKENIFVRYWSLSPVVEYNFARYRLDNDQPLQDYKSVILNRESHEPSFSAGLQAQWHYAHHWRLELGLHYRQISIGIASQTLYASPQSTADQGYKYITSSGFSYLKPHFGSISPGDSVLAGAAQHQLSFISLPVSLGYQTQVKKMVLHASAGVGINYLAEARVETELADQGNREGILVSRLNGTRKTFMSLQAALGLDYPINSQWSLQAFSNFSYALTAITRNNVVATFPYSFGFGVSGIYSF